MLNHFACIDSINVTALFAAVVLLPRLFVATDLKNDHAEKSCFKEINKNATVAIIMFLTNP